MKIRHPIKTENLAEIIPFEREPLTGGEARFRDYLHIHLGRDFKVLTQYSMKNINRGSNGDTRWTQRPDFIVINPREGIWVLEVKHWRPDTIVDFQRAKVLLNPINEDGETFEAEDKNPYAQVQEYLRCLKAEFRNTERELFKRFGNPSVPYGWGVIFTNIFRPDFETRGHTKHAQMDKTLFIDELDYANGSGIAWHLMRWLEKPSVMPVREPAKRPPQVEETTARPEVKLPPLHSQPPQTHSSWRMWTLGAVASVGVAFLLSQFRGPSRESIPPQNSDVETVSAECLSVRILPSAKEPIVGILPNGTHVRVIGETENSWKEIEADAVPASTCKRPQGNGSVHGYVNGQYLTPSNP